MDRDDANIRQFKHRSQQPRVVGGPTQNPETPSNVPVNVYIAFDQGFGGMSDEISDTRFKYVGTSPAVNRYESMKGRRQQFDSVKQGIPNTTR